MTRQKASPQNYAQPDSEQPKTSRAKPNRDLIALKNRDGSIPIRSSRLPATATLLLIARWLRLHNLTLNTRIFLIFALAFF